MAIAPARKQSAIRPSSVRSEPASSAPACTAGAPCTFTGLTNGQPYVFYVTVLGSVPGTSTTTVSQESAASASRKPFATPGKPAGLGITDSGYAAATVSMSWGSAYSGGGTARYYWELYEDGGSLQASGDTTSTGAGSAGRGADTYYFRVRVCNEGSNGAWGADPANCGAWSDNSGPTVVDAPQPSATVSDGGVESGQYHWLQLNVQNFTPGQYTVKCYADGTNGGTTAYATETVTLPANGSVIPRGGCHAAAGPAGDPGWAMIEVVGVLYTPHYTPWT